MEILFITGLMALLKSQEQVMRTQTVLFILNITGRIFKAVLVRLHRKWMLKMQASQECARLASAMSCPTIFLERILSAEFHLLFLQTMCFYGQNMMALILRRASAARLTHKVWIISTILAQRLMV